MDFEWSFMGPKFAYLGLLGLIRLDFALSRLNWALIGLICALSDLNWALRGLNYE